MFTLLFCAFVAYFAFTLGRTIERRDTQKTLTPPVQGELRFPQARIDQDEQKPLSGERVFAALFLFGWLIAWSAAIALVLMQFTTGQMGGASIFIYGWLIAAIAGWLMAVNTLYRLVTGKPVSLRRRSF